MERIKIGLIIESYIIDFWKVLILEEIQKSSRVEISHVIVVDELTEIPKTFTLKNLYIKSDYKIFKENIDCLKQVDITDRLKDIKTLAIRAENREIKLSEEEINNVRIERSILCLNLTNTIFDSNQLTKLYSQGVWQYASIDERGGILNNEHSINEFYRNSSINGLALVQINTTITKILSKGFSKTNPISLYKSKNKLLLRSSKLVCDNLNLLFLIGEESFEKHIQNQNLLFYNYEGFNKKVNGFLLFVKASFRIANYIYKSKFRREKWKLIYSFGEENKLSKFSVYSPPKGNECADPFVLRDASEGYVFFESINIKKLGSIHCISIKDLKANKNSTPVLERNYHLSYPCIFKYEDYYYMIPETKQNNSIELFRCIEFPYKWEKEHTVIDNIEAVDTTILYYNNKWWIFTNIARVKGASASEELHVLWSNSPLSKNWTPLISNPQVSDIRYSRNGGRIIRRDNKLYRVSQDCAVKYGYSVAFHEITELTETSYKEKLVNKILPGWEKNVEGIHTVANDEDFWVMDIRMKE
jgi:hypothetical protein